jgi:hypothetical protein
MSNNQTLSVPAQTFGFGLPAKTAGFARFASSDDFLGDLLKISGKTGECTYGAQGTVIELPHTFAVLIGLVQVGYQLWVDGKPVSAFDTLANEDLNPTALKESIPTDPSKWEFNPKTGERVDPRKQAIKVPMVDLETGHLFTYVSNAVSHYRAWQKSVRACLVCQRANPETTANHVPVVKVSVRSFTMDSAEVWFPVLEVEDWIPERIVISALGRTGNAIAFGLSNEEAVNADIAEAEAELENPKPAKRGPRL